MIEILRGHSNLYNIPTAPIVTVSVIEILRGHSNEEERKEEEVLPAQ